MRKSRARLAVAGLFLFFAASLPAAGPKLYVQETEFAKVFYYDPNHEYLVQHLIRCFQTAFESDRTLFGYRPQEKVAILLEDFGDFGHGGAGTVPKNFVSVGLEPLSYTFETLPANERIRWIMNHEMVHITMADNGAGPDLLFRKIFRGKVSANPDEPISMFYSSLTSPRHYSPRWYHEGIASFMETWLGGGMGRALGGYDEMVFRAIVRDESYIYSVVGLEAEGTAIDFQVGANAYLYGTRFMTHLVRQYGPDKLLRWVSRTKDSRRFFDTNFKEVYGVPLQTEWQRWIDGERVWQADNLKKIQEYPLTQVERISTETLGSVSRSYYDPEKNVIYAAVRSLGQMAHLAAIHPDTGKVDRLTDIKGASLYYVSTLSHDPKGARIFFSSDHNNWRDLNVLDLKTGNARRLIRDSRVGDLVYSPVDGGLWGMRHHNGLSMVVRLTEPFDKIETLWTLEYGNDLFDIDISPDGRYLTGGMTDLSGRQKVVRFEIAKLRQKDASFEVLHDFEYNTPGNFVYSPDGRYLYGSSYYTGVSNLWRYDFEARKMDILTNCATGLFRPLPLADGRLIAYEYNSKGFSPAWIKDARPLSDVNAVPYFGQSVVEKYPQLRDWKLPSPAAINVESLLKRTGRYHPQKEMSLASIYPIVQGYKDTAAVGLRAEFADRLHAATAYVTASYSPDGSLPWNERFHAGMEAKIWNLKLSGYYNNADFYDLFGPTKNSRKGFALRLENTHTLLYDTPRLLEASWNIAGFAGLDRLPDAQNVAINYRRFLTGRVGLKYEAKERALGAVDEEKGVGWTVYARTTYTGPKAFPRVYGTYDRGFMLPLRNSSVWFRTAGGKAIGNPNDPFANFYFGGFGNNWIDHQEISRYRQYYAFPGVELNAIGATNFGKAMVEWNAPPLRFKRLGTPSAYVNWARLSLFSTGLFTNLASGANRGAYGNLGAQLDFRIVLFTYLNSTFSAGYAVATDRHGRRSTEYMVSLKLL
jgi:hypothetical protein